LDLISLIKLWDAGLGAIWVKKKKKKKKKRRGEVDYVVILVLLGG
jgi:hypothetical protein